MKEEERQAARLLETISFSPIGIIHSEHTLAQQTPAQPVFAQDCRGTLEVFPPYAAGLKDIEGFPTREVAGILGCDEAQVRVLLSRARCGLREILKKMIDHEKGTERTDR